MTEVSGNHPHGAPCWVDLGVPDHRRAMDFYGPLFGWEFDEGPAETGNYTMCRVGGKPVAAIMKNQGETECWWNVYFASDDPDGAAKRVTDAGGTVVMAPMDVMDAGRMAMAKDPSGAQFGLWQGRAHTGTQLINEPGSMCWNELVTPDSATARSFYGSVLERQVEDMGVPDFDYATVKLGADAVASEHVAGIWGVPGERARWQTYFVVDDTDAAVSRATDNGGRVVREATDSPYGRFAIVADPYGATMAVMVPGSPE